MTGDRWQVTIDSWRMTCDMWHRTHSVGETFSQKFSSLALPVGDWQCIEDIWTKGSFTESQACLSNSPGYTGSVNYSRDLVRLCTHLSLKTVQLSPHSLFSKSSKHHYSQTVRARELKFWENGPQYRNHDLPFKT